MTHQEIQELLLRYRQGRCTDAEFVKIHNWYNNLNKDSQLALDDHERDQLENKLLNSILENVRDTDTQIIPVKAWWRSVAFYSGVAATVLVTLGYFLVLNKPKTLNVSEKEPILIHMVANHMVETENQTNKDKRVTLEDKSVIVLSPNSKIIYPDKFSRDKREVQLVGDAFFEITKDPSKPFCVYSGNLITRVLGTSFRIKSKTKDHVEVEVVTGKVSVFENKEVFGSKQKPENAVKSGNGVVLTPNQRATYYPDSRHLITSLVETPVIIDFSVNTEKLVFSNTLLPDIIAGLQQEYGIEIVLANEGIAKCTFTGDLSELPLYEKLDLICKSNAAAYEVKGTRILINGIGCEEK